MARSFAFQEKPKQKNEQTKKPSSSEISWLSETVCKLRKLSSTDRAWSSRHRFGTSGSGCSWRANVWWTFDGLKRMREKGPNRGEHQKAKSKARKAQWREIPDWGAEVNPSPSPAGCQRQRARKRRGQPIPLVPIHSWSCSSLKVSLTFPPDLLYMPDNGTAGRRSWGHKSAVRERNQ